MNAKQYQRLVMPREHDEQVELFTWARLQAPAWPELRLLFAVPNGARTTTGTAIKLKAEGLTKGVPDIWLPVARGGKHGLVIEMKRLDGGTLSKEQRDWLAGLTAEGYAIGLCLGFDDARGLICAYLGRNSA